MVRHQFRHASMMHEDPLPPPLTYTASSSSSSSQSPPRMMSSSSGRWRHNMSDSNILRGAEILQQQITQSRSESSRHSSPYSDWSEPLPPPDSPWREDDDDDDDDTTAVLARASEILNNASGLSRSNGAASALCHADPFYSYSNNNNNKKESEQTSTMTPLDLLQDLQSNEWCKGNKPRDQWIQEEREKYHAQKESVRALHQHNKNHAPDIPCKPMVSRLSAEYQRLAKDPGYCHAQRAGVLWQSLVSQHVRFPASWFAGSRGPPLGVLSMEEQGWLHMGRHRVRHNPFLLKMVHSRGSPGRLLLHLMVRDLMLGEVVLDIAVGCFHPNARGVRETHQADPYLEGCRDLWLAMRPRTADGSVMESIWMQMLQHPQESPLGDKHEVNNGNMRAVFGETAPSYTVFVLESDVYELFSQPYEIPPAAVLLEEYHPEW